MTKQQLFNFFKNNEMYIGSAKAPIHLLDIYFNAYVKSEKTTKIKFTPILAFMSKSQIFYQIIKEQQIINHSIKLYNDYLKDKHNLDKIINKHVYYSNQLDKFWQKYHKNNNLTDKKLTTTFKQYIKIFTRQTYYDAYGEDKGLFIENFLIPKFANSRKITQEKAIEIINILSHPNEQVIFNKEKIAFINLSLYISKKQKLKKALVELNIEKLKQDKKLFNEVNLYIKNYFWKNTNFYQAKKLTFSSVIKEIQNYLKENKLQIIKKELSDLTGGFKKIHNQKKKLITKLKLTGEEKKDIEFITKTSCWIDIRKHLMMKKLYYFIKLINDIAKRKNVSTDVMFYLTIDEVLNLIQGKNKVSKPEINKRKKGFAMIFQTNHKTKSYYGKEAQLLFSLSKNIASQVIKGFVASTGNKEKLVGTANIVLNPCNDKFTKGAILITSMTRIEFVPLMHRAKAIVTNEGGIACHAAVVSREFGIPCIIGTKIATDNIKTGDKIEMDLKTGEIKILK